MGKYMKALAGILVCLLFLTACGGGEGQEEGNRSLREDVEAEREASGESESPEESDESGKSDEPIESIAPDEDEASVNGTEPKEDDASGSGGESAAKRQECEPEDANANAMEENFTGEEQERIREFLETMGVSYEESFADVVKYGCGESVWVTAEFKDGTTVTGKRYKGSYPTIGNFDLMLFLAENGYTYWHQPDTGYLTDDPERAGLMTEDSRDIYSRLTEEGDYFPGAKSGRVTRKAGECIVTADFPFADETDFVAEAEGFVELRLEGIWEECGLSQSITMKIPYSNNYYYTAFTVECRDINFDGYDDLSMVTGNAWGSGGSWQCCLGLIWNPTNKMFEPMDSYPELQTDFDSERQRVVVRYRSGAGNEYVESYTVVDGAYQLTEMLHMSESLEPDRPKDFRLYHYVNGELADEHWVSDIYEAAELYPDLDYWWKG